ncbi:hypothetical protein [Streptomyces sp. NPDC004546]|uniref:hypothetical protein n=1 Tax=unclassified Streptomyces TaxID=2593676 RepID=UPI0033A0B798
MPSRAPVGPPSARPPELDQIAFSHAPADLKAFEGPHADYLEPLVDRYARRPMPAAAAGGV